MWRPPNFRMHLSNVWFLKSLVYLESEFKSIVFKFITLQDNRNFYKLCHSLRKTIFVVQSSNVKRNQKRLMISYSFILFRLIKNEKHALRNHKSKT